MAGKVVKGWWHWENIGCKMINGNMEWTGEFWEPIWTMAWMVFCKYGKKALASHMTTVVVWNLHSTFVHLFMYISCSFVPQFCDNQIFFKFGHLCCIVLICMWFGTLHFWEVSRVWAWWKTARLKILSIYSPWCNVPSPCCRAIFTW